MSDTDRSAATARYPSRRRALLTLGVLLVAYIVSFLDRQILALMVDPIRHDLSISDFQMSLLQGLAFALFFTVMGIPIGRLSDRLNRTYVIAAGIAWWSVMTALCGIADGFVALFVFRMGVGLGEAALAPAAYSILGDSFVHDKLVRATSLFGQGTTLGAGLSLLVGGQLIEAITRSGATPFGLVPWKLTFIAVGLPGLLVAAVVLLLREPQRHGHSTAPAPRNLAVALARLWQERGVLAPLYICGTLLSVINFGAVTWFPTHLIRNFHVGPGKVGLILGPIHLVCGLAGAALGAFLTEYLIRRGGRDPYLRALALVATAIAVSMFTPLIGDFRIMIAFWCVSIVVQGAYSGSVTAAIQVTVPNELRGLATAILLFMSNLGGLALGSALIGGVSSLFFAGDPAGIGKAFAAVGIGVATLSAVVAYIRLGRAPSRI